MSAPMKPVELTVVDTNTAEWQGFPVEYINATLEHIPLVNDADTGVDGMGGLDPDLCADSLRWSLWSARIEAPLAPSPLSASKQDCVEGRRMDRRRWPYR